jgi:hypothetical protein
MYSQAVPTLGRNIDGAIVCRGTDKEKFLLLNKDNMLFF